MSKRYSATFTAYASSQGRTVAEQLAHDGRKYPGGCMCGFICWMADVKTRFRKLHPEAFTPSGDILDRPAWEAFLKAQGFFPLPADTGFREL